MYPSSSGILLQYLNCFPVWHGAHGSGSTAYLLADPSIKCTDSKYLAFQGFYVLPMIAIFVVGFPAVRTIVTSVLSSFALRASLLPF